MKNYTNVEWFDYPDNKPTPSKWGSKIFYYAVPDWDGFDGLAFKCWYSNDGHWLCDIARSSIKVKKFTPCPKNAKHELDLKTGKTK